MTNSFPSSEGFSNIFSSNNLFGLAGQVPANVEQAIIRAQNNPGPIDNLIVYENTFSVEDSDLITLDQNTYQLALQQIIYNPSRWFEATFLLNGESYTLRSNQGVHFDDVWYLEVQEVNENAAVIDIRHFQSASTCYGITGQTAITGAESACCEGLQKNLPNCLLDIIHEPVMCGEWVFTCQEGVLTNEKKITNLACPTTHCSEGTPIHTGYDTQGCATFSCPDDQPNQCKTGETSCNGMCTDLMNDDANCGECGTACIGIASCVEGSCEKDGEVFS